ncbi:superoxide dismutase family protein [Pseudonocardia acidicola]|uniref:Superoxide dismutase family protein n=1 Tax=Pseudonocardia acidicola TaxID=2724939 RepID=A0ABX1SCM6_9PSEU|nr:superoxide dismutase family protein [Pseudonocardia acidicola]NMH98627.1 superoxide dismutase family protein [Pseudonocardia acidicola]
MRDYRLCAPLLLSALVLTGCSAQADQASAETANSTIRATQVQATFATGSGTAITYAPDLVPVGATAEVTSTSGDGKATVTLELSGLLPDRRYGAHAHTNRCGAAPADAGAHFQHVKDPAAPSVDPAYANPQNEIWLDFQTDAEGKATATSTVAWEFTDQAHPRSVVVHAERTATEPGKAGTAGDRAACVSVDF